MVPQLPDERANSLEPTLLVVDDHDATRTLLSEVLLRAFPGCRLLRAANAETALDLCRSESPEVVIMDIEMPGMSGIEATSRIRAQWPGTKVIMHTMIDEQVYRNAAAAAGAAAFIVKSGDCREIVAVVSRLLGAAPLTR